MIAPVEMKEDVYSTSAEYYYVQPSSHPYYCSLPFHNDSNNPHHYRPSIYETNHYAAFGHQELNHHMNETNLSNPVSSTVYRSGYYQRCPSAEHTDDIAYTSKASDYRSVAPYDYNLPSSIPALLSNPVFSQHSPYGPFPSEQVNDSTSNSPVYSAPCVSSRFDQFSSMQNKISEIFHCA